MAAAMKKPPALGGEVVDVALGKKIDRLYALRQQKAKAEAKVKSIEIEEKALEDELVKSVKKAELNGAVGKFARVSITPKEYFNISDMTKLIAYIKKNGAFDLFQRRIAVTAVRERLEGHDDTKGTILEKMGLASFTKEVLSLTKLK